jgi:hypothetical protein
MKPVLFVPIAVLTAFILFSCEKEVKDPDLEDFCAVAPEGWECELIQDYFSQDDIPQDAGQPVAIIKYVNPERQFTRSESITANPSLILDIYPVGQKNELNDFIRSQRMYSWCIPVYYGETKDYFILTSPCFINGGTFTAEADSCIQDLQEALESIITKMK